MVELIHCILRHIVVIYYSTVLLCFVGSSVNLTSRHNVIGVFFAEPKVVLFVYVLHAQKSRTTSLASSDLCPYEN